MDGDSTNPGPGPDVERTMQALLDLIESERTRQCGQILGAARAHAAALRSQARAEAHLRLRQVFDEQRQRSREALAAAQARLATQRRLHEQQRTAALLALARERLPLALQALWQQDDARTAWVDHTLAAARRQLPRQDWQIAHPPGWPVAEREAWHRALAADGIGVRFSPAPAMAAGLKVAADGSVIDSSLQGLLAARDEIDARLLRLLEAGAGPAGVPP